MHKSVKKIVLTGMFTAMIFVLTMFVKVNVASGYVHFGDALVYICAAIIGGPWAVIAGALGEGLADIAGGFAAYFPATVLVKAFIAIPFIFEAKKSDRILTLKTGLFTVLSGAITVGGYFIADLIIDKSYAVVDIPGNIVQAVGSAVIFIIIAAAFDKAKIKSRILKSFE